MTRIAPLEPPYSDDAAEQMRLMMPPGMPPIGLFRTFARHLPMTKAMRRVRGGDTRSSQEDHTMTTQTTMKIAVAGATGRLGRHLVDVLGDAGHDVVAMSRSSGVDLVTGDGLAEALAGVGCIVDAATGSSPDEAAATEFFTAAAHNLHDLGERAGVQRIVVVSIVGTDRYFGGYGAAKLAHEHAALAGVIPVRVVRATQFHEFVAQLVAARSVAEVLADVATSAQPDSEWGAGPMSRSPARARRTWRRWRGYSSPGAVIGCASRRSATLPTRTAN